MREAAREWSEGRGRSTQNATTKPGKLESGSKMCNSVGITATATELCKPCDDIRLPAGKRISSRLGKGGASPSHCIPPEHGRCRPCTPTQEGRAPLPAPTPREGSKRQRRVADRKDRVVLMRCTAAAHAALTTAALRAGLSVSAYLRTLATGSPGPRAVRRPPAERVELARLLAELGKIGSNVNQLARVANTNGELPPAAALDGLAGHVQALRGALMAALGRGD